MEGVAAGEPAQSKPAAANETVTNECLPGVLGAARFESTRRWEHRSEYELIPTHERRREPRPPAHRRPAVAASARATSRSSSAASAASTAARATKTRSSPPGRATSRRYASRSRRLARLRLTAPRIWRLAAKPARAAPARGRHRSTKARRSSRRPCWKTVWISLGFVRRASRGRLYAPTAAFTPARLDAKPLAPFRAPPLENFPTTLGLHSSPEPVRLLPAPRVRLKRPLHRENSFRQSLNLRSVLTALGQVKARPPLRAHFAM